MSTDNKIRQTNRKKAIGYWLLTAAMALLLILAALVCYPFFWHTMGESAASGFTAAMEIDLNTADVETLCLLPGVGPEKAKAIVAEREANGRFSSVEDAARVPGIGEKTIAGWQGIAVAG